MEAKECSQSGKAFPDLKYSRRRSSLITDGNEAESNRAGSRRRITVAPKPRYLSDRQYVMRKPQLCLDRHTPILKTSPPKHMGKRDESAVSGGKHTDEDLLTSSRGELAIDSFRLPHRDGSSPLVSTQGQDSPEFMGISGYEGERNQRPKLASTGLYPHGIPCSGYSSPRQLRRIEGSRAGETKLSSHTGHSRKEPMTPCQLNYWVCAIPKASPPSPDRLSSDWDPNSEYKALLDYTYPLKRGQGGDAWDNCEFQEDSLLYSALDSGIELENLCGATNLTGLERSLLSAGQRSPERPSFSRSTDDIASSSTLSLKTPVGLSLDRLDGSNNRGGQNHYESIGQCYHNYFLTSHSDIFTSTAYNCSLSVLPPSRCIDREVDEEFRPLPEKLEELELVSKQVRKAMMRLRQPIGEAAATCIFLPEEQEATDDLGSAKLIAATHRSTPGGSVEPIGEGALTGSSLREVEELIKQLCGLTLPNSQGRRQEDQQHSDSLMQHIQVFCSHLEQLIQQLYTVSDKMELLSAPTVDINSLKSHLADYQSFQKEVSSHQPLTSCVLQTGQLLLSCIDNMAPRLSDALLLIEQWSRALQTHTEHFLSSILSAMDSLTQPTLPTTAGRY